MVEYFVKPLVKQHQDLNMPLIENINAEILQKNHVIPAIYQSIPQLPTLRTRVYIATDATMFFTRNARTE